LISERQSKARKANEDRSGLDRIGSYGMGWYGMGSFAGDRTGCVLMSEEWSDGEQDCNTGKYMILAR